MLYAPNAVQCTSCRGNIKQMKKLQELAGVEGIEETLRDARLRWCGTSRDERQVTHYMINAAE